MSEPNAISVIVEPLLLIAHGIWNIQWSWYLSWLGRVIAIPLKIVTVPLFLIVRFLLILLSPFIHIFSSILGALGAFADFLASLEPLYSFFGVAAAFGIAVGVTLAVFSSLLTSWLGMRTPSDGQRGSHRKALQEGSVASIDDYSSNETDWQWLETSPSRRKIASGLLSETIHEEEDDSDV